MHHRRIAAALLVAAGLVASTAAADAEVSIRDALRPNSGQEVRVASLLHDLRAEYAATHERRAHNEIVLILNAPASAFR